MLPEIEALWSPEGQIAALSASVVALADALGLEGVEALDNRLSDPAFDFESVLAAQQSGETLPALLHAAGVADQWVLNDPSLHDTAMMIVSQDSLSALAMGLADGVDALLTLTEVHQLDPVGLWLAQHLAAGLQGQMMVLATRDALPAQVPSTLRATASLANALSLTVPDLPWTADRWPITDQVTSLQSLSGLLCGFGVDVSGLHAAAAACFTSAGKDQAPLMRLHYEAARALTTWLAALDQWTPESSNQSSMAEGERALVQGALARAREVLEQATGEPE